ncbi:hypothetical protein ACFVYA_21680 [Amycolatopsis sp. NPDC058278]|uniref:hypothetical protein n=1 Tax=Amycolatopsis sp. NPDC058278 TaxID=3346417 RepID=UPI0036DBA1E9
MTAHETTRDGYTLAELVVVVELSDAARTTDTSPAPRAIAERPPTRADEQIQTRVAATL